MTNPLDAVLPVAASIAPDWLRNLCSWLWAVPFLASILSAMIALGAQRDRRDEHSVDDRFNNELVQRANAISNAIGYSKFSEIHSVMKMEFYD